ncbi:type II secretion system GspH family protein [Patescibacteria group bacterium]|nr:type II secretion system GspH family protein [Patescibacteria group bacterium]MBU1890935.1 type II secretion system GspH family protein [Patescibacteria group bacterium]
MKKYLSNSGFTLIELLVVVSMMVFLTAAIVVYLKPTQAEARDSKRKADMAIIQSALNLYFESNGEYPSTSEGYESCFEVELGGIEGGVVCSSYGTDPVYWIPGINDFMSPPPRDPGKHANPDHDAYYYMRDVASQTGQPHSYVLFFMLENGEQDNVCDMAAFKFPPEVLASYNWSTRCPD